jgi:Raf kinase inhibitor-like YbhB/YbcL family protein
VKVAGFVWVHWLLYNLPPETISLPENVPANAEFPDGSLNGKTSFGGLGYGGPCPPDSYHNYIFKLYALNTGLDLDAGATKEDLLAAMEGHILAEAELVGGYKRK